MGVGGIYVGDDCDASLAEYAVYDIVTGDDGRWVWWLWKLVFTLDFE